MTDPIIQDRRSPKDCLHEREISGLLVDRDSMKKTMDAVSMKLDLILAQITKVAVLEEKHSNATSDINRAHLYIVNVEKEVEQLGREVREFIAYTKGVTRTAWAVWSILAGTVFAVMVKVMFFMGAHGVTG